MQYPSLLSTRTGRTSKSFVIFRPRSRQAPQLAGQVVLLIWPSLATHIFKTFQEFKHNKGSILSELDWNWPVDRMLLGRNWWTKRHKANLSGELTDSQVAYLLLLSMHNCLSLSGYLSPKLRIWKQIRTEIITISDWLFKHNYELLSFHNCVKLKWPWERRQQW